MKSKPGGKLRRGQYERVFKRGVAEAALSRKRIAQMTADEYLAAVAAAQNAASGRPEERLSELLSRRSAWAEIRERPTAVPPLHSDSQNSAWNVGAGWTRWLSILWRMESRRMGGYP